MNNAIDSLTHVSSENTVFWEINLYKVFNYATNIILLYDFIWNQKHYLFFSTSKTTGSFDF